VESDDLASLAGYAAIGLLVERAATTGVGFVLNKGNAASIVRLCRLLDGLPLAIELAASRLGAMSAPELSGRLERSFRILQSSRRTVLPRHRSLWATIDWSYHLLDEREQRLFARLAVFAGSFDLEAAEQVCHGAEVDEADVTSVVASLVAKSMVTADPASETTRYRLLETVRQYARERLTALGELDATRDRHARYMAELTERAGVGLLGPNEAYWVERLARNYDNLRVAVQWAIASRDGDLALRLVVGLPDFTCWRIGYEFTEWSEAALRLLDGHTHPLAAAVYGGAARGAWCRGDFPRATRLALASGAPEWVEGTSRCAKPQDVLAVVALYEGRVDEAVRHYERQVELARTAGDPLRLSWALFHLAACHAVRRDPLAGRPEAEEALALARPTGNPTAVAIGLYGLGLALKKTDPERAVLLLDESAETSASVRNRWFYGVASMEAAATRAIYGDPTTARLELLNVLEHWDRLGEWTQQWLNLRYITRLLVRLGQHEAAALLHGSLRAGGKPSPLQTTQIAELRDRLGDGFDDAVARGAAMPRHEVVAYARACLTGAAIAS
jgi:tetratricopeptide (TPR) repeat protein